MGVGGEAVTEFEQIYRAYFQDVELYLRAISHNESLAEELTEQVFFQALNALPKFRGDCDIRTWLCSMARNAYLSHLRKERPSQPIDELEISDPKQAVEEQIMDAQQAMAVHRVLHDLPEPYKDNEILHKLLGIIKCKYFINDVVFLCKRYFRIRENFLKF